MHFFEKSFWNASKTFLAVSFIFSVLSISSNAYFELHKNDKLEKEVVETKRSKWSVKLGGFEYEHEGKPKEVKTTVVMKNESMKDFRSFGMAFGVLGLCLSAAAAFVSKNYKQSSVALGFALIGIGWEYVMYAVGIAIFIIIMGSMS